MGRKPNPLILEFFERGQKLEDNSNRYQHTCKACGEKFPKGRIDSLTAHLFKKCPVIPLHDRQRAVFQLHELPDLDPAEVAGRARRTSLPERQKHSAVKFPALDVPTTRHDWTPLQTLAEVSRQIDLSEKRTPTPQEKVVKADAYEDHPALEDRGDSPGPSRTYEDWPLNDPKELDFSGGLHALPPIQSFPSMTVPQPTSPHLPGLSLPPAPADLLTFSPEWMATEATMDLQAELSRPGLLEPVLSGAPHNAGISDKFFHPRGSGMRSSSTWPFNQQMSLVDPLLLDGSQDPGAKAKLVQPRAATFPRRIAMNPNAPHRAFTSEFSTSDKQMKPKVRGRFSDLRRKEVQEVRKLGACIRCRMLKKPCSGGDPCRTCRSVESARLWKQPCVRTRIADELELYSAGRTPPKFPYDRAGQAKVMTGVYAVLAMIQVKKVKNQAQFHHFPGRIEAKHYEDSPVYVECSALEGRVPQPATSLTSYEPLPLRDESQDLRLLDSDSEDLPAKLEGYIKDMTGIFIEREPSQFMRSTLQFALELSKRKKDSLLHRVLELWTVSHVWVDLELKWITVEISASEGYGDRPRVIDDETNRDTYKLLCSQLRAAAEKRAAQISKTLLNELERRLLQRAQSGCFETYLVAICLLNCVERSSWLFQSWDSDCYLGKWPLDRKPYYYYQQSERFADMLHMLLRMRGLPPKTHESPDGILAADNDETARQYFESIHISIKTLEQGQNALFDPTDSRSLELKFCARLLLPS